MLGRDDPMQAQRKAAEDLIASTANYIAHFETTLDPARDLAEKPSIQWIDQVPIHLLQGKIRVALAVSAISLRK